MESDIHGLDADLQAKTASLKLAHTRLENRTNRPGMDLCRDEVNIDEKILTMYEKLHPDRSFLFSWFEGSTRACW